MRENTGTVLVNKSLALWLISSFQHPIPPPPHGPPSCDVQCEHTDVPCLGTSLASSSGSVTWRYSYWSSLYCQQVRVFPVLTWSFGGNHYCQNKPVLQIRIQLIWIRIQDFGSAAGFYVDLKTLQYKKNCMFFHSWPLPLFSAECNKNFSTAFYWSRTNFTFLFFYSSKS